MNQYSKIEIHILKDILNLHDSAYQYLLYITYGKKSSTELTESEREEVVTFLKQLFNSDKTHLTYEQFQYIKKLAKSVKIENLRGYIHKITSKENILKLTKQQASTVIRSLQKYNKK